MSRGTNQKLKLMYIAKILLEKTDEEHKITIQELITELERCGVTAERKSIYDDFEVLRQYGMDIIKEQQCKNFYYYVGQRDFEVAELKLLVDAVQSSRFISEKKSRQLIKKLEKLVSEPQAKQLNRQVYVHGRVKSMNESIFYSVDKIHYAISNNQQIQFQYYQWDVNKKMVLRRDGKFYVISPWELIWDNEYYYLVGYDAEAGIIKHFRVDKMYKISFLEEKRAGKEIFDKMDMASYAEKRFGMYDGEERTVQLDFKNELAGVVLDRFGNDIMMRPIDDGHFRVSVGVAVSSQFFGWVMSFGDGVKIVGPDDVVCRMREAVQTIMKQYE